MLLREKLQKIIDEKADDIAEILPGGLKDVNGKWILVCPVMERFNLDFSKVSCNKKEVKPKRTIKKKSKSK